MNETFFKLVQSAVRDVINDYEYDSVTFVPEPAGLLLCLGMVAAASFGTRWIGR